MTFEEYLHRNIRRNPAQKIVLPKGYYIDELEEDLERHYAVITDWLIGGSKLNPTKMLETMKYFDEYFGDAYKPTPNRWVYRGQQKEITDGMPRSYTYNEETALGFAQQAMESGWWAKNKGILIKRKVCYSCPDHAAFDLGLDIGKALRGYQEALTVTGGKASEEQEVVLLNLPPKGQFAGILEVRYEVA